jgi:flagellar basal body-associated protein FliL
VRFAFISLCVASQRLLVVVVVVVVVIVAAAAAVYFVIGSVRKLLDTPSYAAQPTR